MVVGRFDVYLVSLDPTEGSEIKKTRPCLVVSPDEMRELLEGTNWNISTIIPSDAAMYIAILEKLS